MASQRITVLHVDDDPQFGELTKTMLEREDETFDVIPATDPHEVEGLLEQHAVDCLVSDYDMPGMDGIELFERIREDDPALPVILYTGKGTEAVASRAISAGVTDYLQKESGSDQFAVLANRIYSAVEHRLNERKREQYRAVIETAGDAMYVLDEDGYIEIVNEAFERMSGYDREKLLGNHVSEFLSSDQVEQGSEAIQSLLQDEDSESERFTFRGPGPDGEERLYETTLSLVDQGGFAGSVGIVRDITEERRQEELLSGLFEESLHGIGVKEIVTDESGEPIDYVYKRVNDRFEELTGLDAEGVVGKRATEVIDGIEDTPFIDVFGEVALDGTTAQFEQYSEPLDRHYEVSAFSPRDGECISIFSEITERKEREEELEKYGAMVEHSSDLLLIMDENGTVTYQSSVPSEIVGFEFNEFVGGSAAEYIHPEDLASLQDDFERVLQHPDELVVSEYRAQTKDGQWRWFENRAQNELDTQRIEGILVAVRDITERKQREQELERTSELLRHTQELAGVGGWEADVETGEQAWTRETYEIHDLDPDGEFNPTVESGIEFYHPEDRAEIDRLVTRCVEEGEPYETELRLRTAGDRLRWVRTTGEPVLEGESITSIRGAIQDITEQRNYEQTLHQLVQRTDELINETDKERIAEVAVDIASEVIEAPLAGVHLRTEDSECLEGVAANDDVSNELGAPPVYSRTESDTASEIVFQAFDRGESLYIEDTENYGTLANETPAKSAVIHPLDDHGVLIVSTTERNGFTEADQSLIELVAQSVTAALNEAERKNALRASEQRLRRERDRLDEFASVISHDLRNPVNVATLRADLAAQECDSEHLPDVVDALSRMESLIDDLLLLARQGKTVGETEQIVLKDVVSGCWRNVETGDATLTTNGEATLAADRSRLIEVLENLFRNALDHGGESVTVTVGVLADENGFYVADNGPGIPPEDRDDVFDSGFSTNQGGTGLGLAIAKRICEAHGWKISVTESETGGARFEITGIDSLES